jgi:hypothetical protein
VVAGQGPGKISGGLERPQKKDDSEKKAYRQSGVEEWNSFLYSFTYVDKRIPSVSLALLPKP